MRTVLPCDASLTHEDMTRYRQFPTDPQPNSTWITENGARYSMDDPRWRPFARRLEPGSIKQAVVIIDGRIAERLLFPYRHKCRTGDCIRFKKLIPFIILKFCAKVP